MGYYKPELIGSYAIGELYECDSASNMLVRITW